jgi:hypothetical protein
MIEFNSKQDKYTERFLCFNICETSNILHVTSSDFDTFNNVGCGQTHILKKDEAKRIYEYLRNWLEEQNEKN